MQESQTPSRAERFHFRQEVECGMERKSKMLVYKHAFDDVRPMNGRSIEECPRVWWSTRLLGQSQLPSVPVSVRSLPYPLVDFVLFFQKHFPAAFPHSLSRQHHSCRTPSPSSMIFSFIPLHQVLVVASRRSVVGGSLSCMVVGWMRKQVPFNQRMNERANVHADDFHFHFLFWLRTDRSFIRDQSDRKTNK